MITRAKRSFFSAFALLFAFTALFSSQAVAAAVGTLIFEKGNVTVNGNAVKKGDKIATETVIVVPAGGRAVIDFGPSIGKVTLDGPVTATIYVDEAGNILVAIQGEGGGANIETTGVRNYGAVVRDNGASISSLADRLGIGGDGIGGATGLGLAGLTSGSSFGGGGGTAQTTQVLP